jgi:hypothetical protein
VLSRWQLQTFRRNILQHLPASLHGAKA